jgi:KUP system potassium uptake protein
MQEANAGNRLPGKTMPRMLRKKPRATDRPNRNGDDEQPNRREFYFTCLTVLGVVFGDIGTSPIYALRACFYGMNPFPPTAENVLGILSLISWSLLIIISCKYLLFVMRADNRGEGGILALMALLVPVSTPSRHKRRFLFWMGLFGAALLYGDGVITPAISVLSAVEGLQVATPAFKPYVLPITILILVLLFLLQKRGSAGVGFLFGPVIFIWFTVIALLGIIEIVRFPEVLAAVNPAHAVNFFLRYRWSGVLVLGAVFLVVTGGEALYADMGHFGRRPISFSWFRLVFPALLLNYFGQGALILNNPRDAIHPFYHLAPAGALYPLVILATLATVIASQAIISGAFSLTSQAMQLGVSPRMKVVQTSPAEIGQIYVPTVNRFLMITTILLVLGFGSSSNLAAAYGVAVSTTMLITTILIFFLAREKWKWKLSITVPVTLLFLGSDLSFFGANLLKISEGGWFPIAAGMMIFTLMTTWRSGRDLLNERLAERTAPLDGLLKQIGEDPPVRLPGTAVFMVRRLTGAPPMLVHHLGHHNVLHEQVVLLTVLTEPVPRIPAAERVEVVKLNEGFFRVTARYGFMQSPNVPVALRECEQHDLFIETDRVSYYVARETIIPTEKRSGMMLWREKLFAFMARNAMRATAFYNIPPGQVIEIGMQVEI